MSGQLVNLCFHGIGRPQRDLEPGEATYWIDVDLYHRVLDEVMDDPRVRISFDDGNASDIEIGLPGLVERGLDATFFVLAGRLGAPGSLSADQVGALVGQGMRIGSHGMDHRPWRGLRGARSPGSWSRHARCSATSPAPPSMRPHCRSVAMTGGCSTGPPHRLHAAAHQRPALGPS